MATAHPDSPPRVLGGAARLASLAAVVLVLVLAPSDRAQAGSGRVLIVGDSLAVGTKPYLGAMLAGRELSWDALDGRTTPQGLTGLRAGVRAVRPQAVVVSLGTNDGPDPGRFADRIRRVLAAAPIDACVVWATINRPPRKGPYDGLNRVLRRAAVRDPRMVLVDWDRAVARGAVRLPDGLHPDAAGYRHRSRMIAHALTHRCPSGASA